MEMQNTPIFYDPSTAAAAFPLLSTPTNCASLSSPGLPLSTNHSQHPQALVNTSGLLGLDVLMKFYQQ
jgi:hypothetical protein